MATNRKRPTLKLSPKSWHWRTGACQRNRWSIGFDNIVASVDKLLPANGQVSAATAHSPHSRRRLQTVSACTRERARELQRQNAGRHFFTTAHILPGPQGRELVCAPAFGLGAQGSHRRSRQGKRRCRGVDW